MSKTSIPPIPGATAMTDTLDFVKNLWGSMAVPGMNLPGLTVPTLSMEELDKKISDLKAVEAWLNVNMSMLRGTIQTLEVQRGTIATLKTMGESFAAAVKQPGAAEKSAIDTPYASAFSAGSAKPAGNPSDATPMSNPTIWWNLLQEQFQQAVSSAMAVDPLAPAKPAEAAPPADSKPKVKPGKS